MAWIVSLEKYFNLITSISCFGEEINSICLYSGFVEGLFKYCFKDSVAECTVSEQEQGNYLFIEAFIYFSLILWVWPGWSGPFYRRQDFFLQPYQQLPLPGLTLFTYKNAIILIIFQCKVKSCQAYSKCTVSFPGGVFFGSWITTSCFPSLLLTSQSLCIFGPHTVVQSNNCCIWLSILAFHMQERVGIISESDLVKGRMSKFKLFTASCFFWFVLLFQTAKWFLPK